MSRKPAPEMGYLMREELHDKVMCGLDSLRFLEGLVSDARSSSIDRDDLAGYLQLLLENTYKPLKSLEYQRWAPAGDDRVRAEAKEAPTVDDEAELLRDYRAMQEDDRKHLRRCAEALAYVAEKETDAA